MPINATQEFTETSKLMRVSTKPAGAIYIRKHLPDILTKMFAPASNNTVLETVLNRHNISQAAVEQMLKDGHLDLPVANYAEVEALREELYTDVFAGKNAFVFKVEENKVINQTAALQNRFNMAKQALNDIDADYIDGVVGNGFWPIELFGTTLGQNVTLGFIDMTINPWRESFEGINIDRTECSHLKCEPTDVLDLKPGNTHGTDVAETALKFLPGVGTIDGYHRPIIADGTDAEEQSLLSLETTFWQIERKLKQLEASGQKYAYILNMSMRISQRIAGLLLPLVRDFLNQEAALRIYRLVRRLHQTYPRFQMFISAGNDDSQQFHLLIQAMEVMAVGGHDIKFNHFSSSNAGESVITSALASMVKSIAENAKKSGTSFSSPTLAAMGAIIMDLIPDMKNYELRQLIDRLSVPVDQFFVHNSTTARLRTPVFIFDLVKFHEILSKEYSHRIDRNILNTISARTKTYYFDKLIGEYNVRHVIPNSKQDIRFNKQDKLQFGLTVANLKNTSGEVCFSLSSARIPPTGVNSLIFEFNRKYKRKNAFVCSAAIIEIPANFSGKVLVQATRLSTAEIDYVYKLNDGAWIESGTDCRGLGDVANVMLGLGTDKKVKILDVEALQYLEATTESPTPPPTEVKIYDFMLNGTVPPDYDVGMFFDYSSNQVDDGSFDDDYDDYAQEVAGLGMKDMALSGIGLFFLFALHHLRKKMRATPKTQPVQPAQARYSV